MITLLNEDCLEELPLLDESSVDLILVDPPYGTTKCKWDVTIPLEEMWNQIWRVLKHNGACVIFGAEPFSSIIRSSQMQYYKYDWVWKKDKPTGHLNAKRMPMRNIENIMVFYRQQCTYNPQLIDKDPKNIRPDTRGRQPKIYGKSDRNAPRTIPIDKGYPMQILEFNSCSARKGKSNHPTEKPVDLLEYLIKTYSNQGDVVLDFTMGSGSTGVAAINLNRHFIGIEKDSDYFAIAEKRIENR